MYGLESLKARASGSLPKAILCVRPYTGSQTFANDAASKAKELMSRAQGSLFGKKSGIDNFLAAKSNYIELEVQYNPSSIALDTQAGRQVSSSADNPNQINITKQPTATTMSLQLVFDDMNLADAFMYNQGMTLSNALPLIAGGVRHLTGDSYTVREKMDAIMALLMNGETRQVIFFWSRMCFRGELTKVNSRYTMFNKSGNPIRGTIDLVIRQGENPDVADDTAGSANSNKPKASNYKYDESYWDKQFDKVFGFGGQNMDFSDQSAGSTLGNILNLWM